MHIKAEHMPRLLIYTWKCNFIAVTLRAKFLDLWPLPGAPTPLVIPLSVSILHQRVCIHVPEPRTLELARKYPLDVVCMLMWWYNKKNNNIFGRRKNTKNRHRVHDTRARTYTTQKIITWPKMCFYIHRSTDAWYTSGAYEHLSARGMGEKREQ